MRSRASRAGSARSSAPWPSSRARAPHSPPATCARCARSEAPTRPAAEHPPSRPVGCRRVPLDLNRPRDLSALFNTVFALYGRYFWLFGAMALAVVLPVLVVVDGVGLGQLTSGYDSSPPVAGTYIELAAQQLVITPLVTAMHVHAV